MTDRLWKCQKNYRQYELQQAFHDLILVFMLSSKHSAGSEMETHEMDDQLLASLREEISGRVEELEEPVEIELGCNKIMGGDFVGGRDTLARFKEGRYSEWWPLWYYLGIAESSLANPDAAIEAFKRVLRLSPSNTDAMEELAAIYALAGDEENASKYRKKIEIVRSGPDEGTPEGLA
jgi:tetratricopeptide (TPR) repeat protein